MPFPSIRQFCTHGSTETAQAHLGVGVLTNLYKLGYYGSVIFTVAVVAVASANILHAKILYRPDSRAVDPATRGGNPEVVRTDGAQRKHYVEQDLAAFYKPIHPDSLVFVYFHGEADQLGGDGALLGQYFRDIHDCGWYGIEYPGYGLANPGALSEKRIYETAQNMLQHLIHKLGVQREKIVLCGHSLGCAVAVEMAKRGYGCKLVLVSPFTSACDFASHAYPFLRPAFAVPFHDEFDIEGKASKIRVPTMIVHGASDERSPFWMGERLARLIPDTNFLPATDFGHDFSVDRVDVLQEIASFAKARANE